MVICDNDGNNDGFQEFDLTTLNAEILNGQDATVYDVSYYFYTSTCEFNNFRRGNITCFAYPPPVTAWIDLTIVAVIWFVRIRRSDVKQTHTHGLFFKSLH